MIKLLVWDWNGTLFDDNEQLVAAVNEQLAVYEVPPIDVKKYQETYTVPIRQCFRDLGVPDNIYDERNAEATKLFHDRYEELAENALLRPGAKELLVLLKNHDTSSILLSNHIVIEIEKQLLKFGIAEHFTDILANDAIGMAHSMGKQHRLERYLQLHQTDPSTAVIIGDTVEEIHIGKKLGLHTIAISGGANSTNRLAAEHPDLLVNSLHEIIPALEEKKWL